MRASLLKRLSAAALVLFLCLTACVFPGQSAGAASVFDRSFFNDWISYPDSAGTFSDSGWSYDHETSCLLSLAQNSWSGVYNPDIGFTTGTIQFQMQTAGAQSAGFAWGIRRTGEDKNSVYSFYMYEEYAEGSWCLAYVNAWHTTENNRPPVYQGALGASGGADGKILAQGALSSGAQNKRHKISLKIKENQISLYINGIPAKTVNAPAAEGSFGPCCTGGSGSAFSELSVTCDDTAKLSARFSYTNNMDLPVTKAAPGDQISVKERSLCVGTEIASCLWNVYRDGEKIYSGTVPYTAYTSRPGTYRTTLQITSGQGICSGTFSLPLYVENTGSGENTPKNSPPSGISVSETVTADPEGTQPNSSVRKSAETNPRASAVQSTERSTETASEKNTDSVQAIDVLPFQSATPDSASLTKAGAANVPNAITVNDISLWIAIITALLCAGVTLFVVYRKNKK